MAMNVSSMGTLPSAEIVQELIALAHSLGNAPRGYAILGEGNVSARLDEATFMVKASGASLATADAGSFTRMDLTRALELVRRPPTDEHALSSALSAACADPDASVRPSVESGLHAVLQNHGARWVAHTHATPITALLCSTNAHAVITGPLFPDQVVVCGRYPLLLRYADPGIPLARELAGALESHYKRYGGLPKAIYLQNHGFVAVGQSAGEVLAVTDMAVKAAVILATALSCGGPCYLAAEEADWIVRRADEHHRQKTLGLTQGA